MDHLTALRRRLTEMSLLRRGQGLRPPKWCSPPSVGPHPFPGATDGRVAGSAGSPRHACALRFETSLRRRPGMGFLGPSGRRAGQMLAHRAVLLPRTTDHDFQEHASRHLPFSRPAFPALLPRSSGSRPPALDSLVMSAGETPGRSRGLLACRRRPWPSPGTPLSRHQGGPSTTSAQGRSETNRIRSNPPS
jgi:hypothetical protein